MWCLITEQVSCQTIQDLPRSLLMSSLKSSHPCCPIRSDLHSSSIFIFCFDWVFALFLVITLCFYTFSKLYFFLFLVILLKFTKFIVFLTFLDKFPLPSENPHTLPSVPFLHSLPPSGSWCLQNQPKRCSRTSNFFPRGEHATLFFVFFLTIKHMHSW